MKTNYSSQDVTQFLVDSFAAQPKTIRRLAEGHSSQVFGFTGTDCVEFVLRIRSDYNDLLADKFAYEQFASYLPIPEVIDIGSFGARDYYCVSRKVNGVTANLLSVSDFNIVLPEIKLTIAKTFSADISQFSSYGEIDPSTGKGAHKSWNAALANELEQLDTSVLVQSAKMIGLSEATVTTLIARFEQNLPFVSEVRSLLHGDPSNDNLFVDNGKVSGIIDWEQMAYGDWLRDFSRFSYWGIHDYGDTAEFAHQFCLDAKNINERTAVYWAILSLRNIEFAATQKSEKVTQWLIANANRVLV